MKLYSAAAAVAFLLIAGVVTYSPAGDLGQSGDRQAVVALETRSSDEPLPLPAADSAAEPSTAGAPGALTVAVAGAEADSLAVTGDEAAGAQTAGPQPEGGGDAAGADEGPASDGAGAETDGAGGAASATPASGDDAAGTGGGPADDGVQPNSNPGAEVFEPLRNNKPEFSRYRDVPSAQLPMDQLTRPGAGTPTPNPISGQFRMHCEYSHFSYDDPIVFPGQAGRSHLHMFFGNTEADAFSTSDSLFNRGGSSCNGYELDRSGYWVPALMQGTTQTIVPYEILLYYKTNSPGSVQPFPTGLRMIAGANASDPASKSHYRWKCENSINRPAGTFEPINDGPFFETIPDCRALGYETLGYMIDFPNCWDGVNLDSADHRSHMRYGCAESHPIVFPQLQYIIHYTAPPAGTVLHLSSDPHDCQTGARTDCGFSLHGDFWNAWHVQTHETWINECSRKRHVCMVPSISASTSLIGPGTFDGNPVLQMPAGSYPGAH
ncbi:MAG: DUF1996 domain-containing protein [Actinomycetota bacterium]